MNDRLPYGKRYMYPHMKPQDVVIWERFMRTYPDAYEECVYDQPVGDGADIPADTEENIAAGFKILTQWKIDVIGYKDGKADVIEIKPRAGVSSIGQVVGYAHLLDELDEVNIPIRPMLVTDELRPDMPRLCEAMGVRLVVV